MTLRDRVEQSVKFLRDCGATRVILFGSILSRPDEARDVDVACAGLPANRFYQIAAKLESILGMPVDLIDLDRSGKFRRFVESRGVVLYES